ncbi:MAG: glycoside hydrolase family 16 protein [Candidatus Hinthialibacter antarcticus]|nr:glycoside hydrolase family 16 protein [Candidatus Hinthialibacter antarcticus]
MTRTIILLTAVCLLPFESDSNEASWSLVWSDEFDGESLNLDKWEALFDVSGGGNNELQFYTRREKNVRIEDGVLFIEAHHQQFTGVDTRSGKEKTRDYTSARIRTKGKGDWLYGKIEARAKMPKGQGYWPAIWMMPTDSAYGGWASSGEIDIMEYLGHEPNKVHGTLHYGASWPDNVHSGKPFAIDEGSFADEFHVFALEWEEGVMRWYVDGELYQTQTKWSTNKALFPAPFDKRFHLIMNLAVGGNWPGAPDDETVFPQSLQVDYIRVYQKNAEVEKSKTH